MNKTIITTGDSAFESLYRYTKIPNADIEYAYYGSKSLFLSAVRIVWIKLALPLKRIWYKRIDFANYETIIVFDTFVDSDYLDYIKKKTTEKHNKCFYFWNTYSNSKLARTDIEKNGFRIWSFDYKDCLTYGFSYNPQFYANSWYEFIVPEPIIDVSFVGRDKGNRLEEIDDWFYTLRKKGISCNTYITADKWYLRYKSARYQKYLDYRGMIKKECEGRVVLDYGTPGQYGPTLRVYDAILNCRKIITNNPGVKELAFYSSENFFVLGEDDNKDIAEFINSAFVPICKNKLDYYEASSWIKRFV